MNAEIFAALAQLEKERGIPQSYMVEKITQALVAPLCKWKDLAQVKSAPFEYAALEWWKLDSDKLGSVSKERFGRAAPQKGAEP